MCTKTSKENCLNPCWLNRDFSLMCWKVFVKSLFFIATFLQWDLTFWFLSKVENSFSRSSCVGQLRSLHYIMFVIWAWLWVSPVLLAAPECPGYCSLLSLLTSPGPRLTPPQPASPLLRPPLAHNTHNIHSGSYLHHQHYKNAAWM